MSGTPAGDGACAAARRFLDSHIGSEEASAAERETLEHIERCPECSGTRAVRDRIAAQLRRAVCGEMADPALAVRIRAAIEEYDSRTGRQWSWGRRLMAVAATLVICLGGWIAYELGHLRVTAGAQEAYIASISKRVDAILRVGLGDHVHCTVFRKLPKQPPAAGELAARLGGEYRGLLPVVQAEVPEQYKVVMAHRCSYRGRRFLHFALKGDSGLLSLVITPKVQGETFDGAALARVLPDSGISLYQGSVQRFAIAGFESGGDLVYLVSDLDEAENLRLLASLAAPVQSFLLASKG